MVFIRYYFDSLNPSAIAQQMLLQAMVKKKRHIWFFICGIGTANLIMGLAIYYGIATWVSKFLTLFIMGAAFCMVELTSAFPYFGFLALLTSYHLIFPLALLFMLIYNFMYMLPLILLYFGYNKLQGTTTIKKLESVLDKVSSYIVPVVVSLVGILLVYYGVTSLM